MPVKRIVELPSPSGVAVSSTATFDLPTGGRYHAVWIGVKDTAKDDYTSIVDDIRVKVNGKEQRTMTPAQLNALNILNGAQYGVSTKDGATGETWIPIFFAEPWRKNPATADGMAWGTGNVASFQIELDINAAAAGVSIRGYAEVDNSIVKDEKGKISQAPIGVICKWLRQNLAMNGTVGDFQNLERREYYQQISLFDATLTAATVKVEGYVVREVEKTINDQILTSRDMTPVSTRLDIVYDYDDPIQNGLAMVLPDGTPVRDYQLHLVSSSALAKSIATIIQRIGPPE